MATFRVGQRVRVTGEGFNAPFSVIGCEGAVVMVGEFKTNSSGTVPYAVHLDAYADRLFGFRSDQLEPIQHERNRLVAWSDVPGGRPKVEEFA